MRPPIDTATRLCAVIGNPVEHSLSPAMHNAAFDAEGLNYVYLAFRVENVAACLDGMRALPNFRGLSVTIPHKQAVMRCLDEIDPIAQRIGSVNTITNEDGRLIGASTDGPGTLRAFEDAGVPLAGRRVLFLGAGGAVRAVAFALLEQAGAERVTLLARSAAKAELLAHDLRAAASGAVATGSLDADLARALADHDIIIQGTPMGMYPDAMDQSPIPPALLRRDHVVFDMVYRPLKTRLILDAEAAGCRTILGLEMLVNQAVLQFEIWTGRAAPHAAMRGALLAALGAPHGREERAGVDA